MPEKIQDLMESLKADLNDTTTVSISQISTPDLNTSSLLESIEEKPGVTINSPPSNSDPFFTYKAEKELENEDKHFWTQQYVTSEPDTSSLSLSSTSLEEIEAQDVVPAASSSNSNNLNKVGSPSVTPTLPLLTPLRGRKLSAVLPARRRSSASPASLKNVKSNILKTGLDYNWFNNTSNLGTMTSVNKKINSLLHFTKNKNKFVTLASF
ncbi:hypothetical protein HMI55_004674 [Coelomomyces lativittatus]|nr:hypothetical protein HMI55_004674 [Coelomomyces lativittatus]